MPTKALLAVAACAAVLATAGAVSHVLANQSPASCSAAAATRRSDQDPAKVAAYWTPEQIEQAQQNMRNATFALPSARRGCHTDR